MFNIEFLEIRAVDLVDIAIVAVILYRLYASMRGTIAAQIFLGLVLILGVSVISQFFEMRLLSWLLRTVGDIWVIALIILFQPELRRILLLLGRRGILRNMGDVDVDALAEPMIEAAEELSKRRFGALVVVAGSRDITANFDTGVRVDADLSREMLLSIFNPKSPLHDGAVLISGTRIEAAGVILPFSADTSGHDARLGTRHRAGLGVSEQTDAFVLIVSEETGAISYAREGRLHYDRSPKEVRQALEQVFEAERSLRKLPVWRRIVDVLKAVRPPSKK